MVFSQTFKDKAIEMGIDHFALDSNAMSGGVAIFDFNNDGFDDLYLNGGENPDRLYENIGGKYFREVTAEMGIAKILNQVNTMGVVAGDINNDGFTDLLISTAQNHRCYLLKNNNGIGFTDISGSAGINHAVWSSTATMSDYDLDGDLDIYVGNYVEYDGLPFSINLTGPISDFFYQNNGDETFTLLSNPLSDDDTGATLVASFTDFDQDGDSDLFVLNDYGDIFEPNKLLLNTYPQNTLQEVAVSMGFDNEMQSMGLATGDVDEDGDLDYYITNLGDNFLLENQDGSGFLNIAQSKNVDDGVGFSWGTAFMDINNDSFLDLYVAKGSIFAEDDTQANKLYQYDTMTDAFTDNSIAEGMAEPNRARGMAHGDLNNDGKIDFVVSNVRANRSNQGKALLYINQNRNSGNWIKIILEGTVSNKSAYGSSIIVSAGGREFIKELSGGTSYLSSHSNAIHFGLGDLENIDQLTINWPGKKTETFTDLTVNKTYKVIEQDQIYSYSANYIEICEGERIFINGERITSSGIYTNTYEKTDALDEISITRIEINSASDCQTENNEDQIIDNNHSVARKWNELLLKSIRNDFARPTVHARNLFHTSIAMYDAWAAFSDAATPFFLGNTLGEYTAPFEGITAPTEIESAREEAISYACFRLLTHRFKNAPSSVELAYDYEDLMFELGYDPTYTSTDYTNGSPAALGNYIAQELINFGLQDGSNEVNEYVNQHYQAGNSALVVDETGNPSLTDPNVWQPLTLSIFIDQSGNILGNNTPDFLSPEWGKVIPFALENNDLSIYDKDGFNYWVYNDPGEPVKLSNTLKGLEDPYKWGFAMVAAWSSHLTPLDGEVIDISPASIGNVKLSNLPKNFGEYKSFYNFTAGGDSGQGHRINPVTNTAYQPQMVARGDYVRVLAEFWADGPDSETPPGHWFTILNYVNDHPQNLKKLSGKGHRLDDLEWDIKSYFALGGAMHDAAISAWGLKGYYNYIRPISAIRYMAGKGQSTNQTSENYHAEGIPLIEGYIEEIKPEDPLALNPNNIGKIKIKSWKGNHFVGDPDIEIAGVGWILGEDWVPYQRPSFVTPPFAGYVSGHSTFSRAAANVLALLTGSNFFPGGMGEFDAEKNEFLVFENGPTQKITLQWATYQDASDQCSLSRIWGGIHPPIDDIPGRKIGHQVGIAAFEKAIKYFLGDPNQEEKSFEVAVYPTPINPFENLQIIYQEPIQEAVQFQLFDLSGRLLCEKVIEKNNEEVMSFNVCTPEKGLYILIANSNGKRLFSKKILVR